MKRREKRRQAACKRKEQKDRRKGNSTYSDVELMIDVAGTIVKSDKEFVDGYTAKAGREKKKIIVFATLCAIFIGILILEVDIGISRIWVTLLFWATFVLLVMCFSAYRVYKGRLPFWKKQFQENASFLNFAKSRMHNIRIT